MNILILGGESPRHYDWVRQVASALQPHCEKVAYLDYRHWASGGGIDIEHEIVQVAQLAKGLGEYIVVAKSIGIVIASLAAGRSLLHPTKCIFLGLPLGAVERVPEVRLSFAKLPLTTFMQNTHDPLGSAAEVKAYVSAASHEQLIFLETPGNTHDYSDFELLVKLATN